MAANDDNDPTKDGDQGIQDPGIDSDQDQMSDTEIAEDDLHEIIEDPQVEVLDVMDELELEGAQADVPPQNDAKLVFHKHEGMVFAVCVDPVSCSMAVTGGEDDQGYVWNLSTGDVLLHCSGHKDSVTCVGFSHDSSLVATGDMSGLIKVWNVKDMAEIWSFEVSDLEWLEWHGAAPVLLAGTVDGDVWMWKIPSGDCKTFQSHGTTCTAGKLLPDGRRLCTGYQDGSIRIWDLKSASTLHTFAGHNAHTGSVTCLACHHDNSLVLSGSTDVTARLLSSQNGKVLAKLDCSGPDDKEDDNSVEAVGFSRFQNLAATGTLKGVVTVWDLSTQTVRHRCPSQSGVVRLVWDVSSPLLYTASLDGVLRLYDGRTGQTESEWFGHKAEILDLSLARDSSVMVTSGADGTAHIFSLQQPGR